MNIFFLRCAALSVLAFSTVHVHAAQLSRQEQKAQLVANGKYDLFKVVQVVHEIAAKAQKEVQKQSEIGFSLGKEYWPNPNIFFGPVKQGLYLTLDRFPRALFTPWGRVKIYGGGLCSRDATDQLTHAFVKNLTVAFVKNTCHVKNLKELEEDEKYLKDLEKKDMATYEAFRDRLLFEVPEFYKMDANGKSFTIPQSELEKYEGTNTIITCNDRGGESIYKLLKLGDKVLPESQMYTEQEDWRSPEAIKKEWKLLGALYQDEKRQEAAAEKD